MGRGAPYILFVFQEFLMTPAEFTMEWYQWTGDLAVTVGSMSGVLRTGGPVGFGFQ